MPNRSRWFQSQAEKISRYWLVGGDPVRIDEDQNAPDIPVPISHDPPHTRNTP